MLKVNKLTLLGIAAVIGFFLIGWSIAYRNIILKKSIQRNAKTALENEQFFLATKYFQKYLLEYDASESICEEAIGHSILHLEIKEHMWMVEKCEAQNVEIPEIFQAKILYFSSLGKRFYKDALDISGIAYKKFPDHAGILSSSIALNEKAKLIKNTAGLRRKLFIWVQSLALMIYVSCRVCNSTSIQPLPC